MEMLWEYGKAFVVGGLICLVGQILIDKTKLTPARILVLFVTLGVVLTAVGLYGPLVDFAGAGATVPLTGFGYTMAKGVVKAIQEQGILGILTGGVTAAAAGIAAAVFFGYLAALISKPSDKGWLPRIGEKEAFTHARFIELGGKIAEDLKNMRKIFLCSSCRQSKSCEDFSQLFDF